MFQADTTFLGGKVLKCTLQVLPADGHAYEPRLKRLLLPQGELAQFYDGEQGMRYMAFIALQPDSVRGQHYHKVKEEWFYLIQGQVILLVEDIASKLREAIPLRTGDLVFIPAGIAHALRPLEPGQGVEYSPTRYDRADVYRYSLS
jgi:mannose-6-phosphate isomerase-like protein (cupin superfamily)